MILRCLAGRVVAEFGNCCYKVPKYTQNYDTDPVVTAVNAA